MIISQISTLFLILGLSYGCSDLDFSDGRSKGGQSESDDEADQDEGSNVDVTAVPPQIITGSYLTSVCGPYIGTNGETIGVGCNSLSPNTSFADLPFEAYVESTGGAKTPLTEFSQEEGNAEWQIIFKLKEAIEEAAGTLVLFVTVEGEEHTVFTGDYAIVVIEDVYSDNSDVSQLEIPNGFTASYFDFSSRTAPRSISRTERFLFTDETPAGTISLPTLNYRYDGERGALPFLI